MSYHGYPPIFQSADGIIYPWVKYTKTYTDFSAAALYKELTLHVLPAGGTILASKIKHSAAFTGGGATNAIIQLGLTGEDHRGDYMPGFDIFQTPGSEVVIYSHINQAQDQSSPTNIIVTLNSDVNLNTLATGSVDIWIWVATVV